MFYPISFPLALEREVLIGKSLSEIPEITITSKRNRPHQKLKIDSVAQSEQYIYF